MMRACYAYGAFHEYGGVDTGFDAIAFRYGVYARGQAVDFGILLVVAHKIHPVEFLIEGDVLHVRMLEA